MGIVLIIYSIFSLYVIARLLIRVSEQEEEIDYLKQNIRIKELEEHVWGKKKLQKEKEIHEYLKKRMIAESKWRFKD